MKKLFVLCAAITALGFSASAQSADTTKVRVADTMARPNPMINWDIPKMSPSVRDTVSFSKDSIDEVRIYRTAHGVEEVQLYHGENVVGPTNPQEMIIEGVEVKVKY